jgi:C-terminal processing protease CtpA/Prc
VISASSGLVFPAFANDELPQLKPDVPKMDTSDQPVKRTLKGGVQHNESGAAHELGASTTRPSKLSASAASNRKDSKLTAGTAKVGMLNRLFRMKTAQTTAPTPIQLNSAVQSGVGIIGVKFSLGLGRPPIINRVFPGTPAHGSGLRVDDIIVAVDGVPTNGLSKDEVYGMIVGTPQTTVTLSVLRHGDFIARTMQRMDFNDIPDPLVKRDYMLSL